MKKAIAIVLSIMFVFALTTVTFAAEKKAAAKKMHVAGEVSAVDAKANTVTVKGKKGDVTISVDDKTKFAPKGKTIADVKAGEKVKAAYTEADGKNTATMVDIKAAPAKKEEKKAEKKEAAPAPEKKAPEKKKAAGY